ncbi:hypothetical protein RB620_05195 [Paenibacillus sp. LHD-117]|uniref:hypothetical protein n=1 Tax=Paenibacillus sp. LHD-117 TaxID=3071412 RepID=UPI0027E20043|nr:hypothetical protein [Paenibacillus sp. LHD-117]MDQ6418831.1 hypothetical protein [Paenibacillus sp. LHD-117]
MAKHAVVRMMALAAAALVVSATVMTGPVGASAEGEAESVWESGAGTEREPAVEAEQGDGAEAAVEAESEADAGAEPELEARTEAAREREEGGSAGQICWTDAKIELKRSMKRLWIEHAMWTRSYMVSALAGLEDQKAVLVRLLKNQQDIGDAIKPYYGDAAGDQLAELLKEHILIAGKIVAAAQAGNNAELQKFNKEWYRNADDIATFLAAANPHWSKKELKEMLDAHLALVAEDLKARLEKDWEGSIEAFDKGEEHLIHFADMLSEGIVLQFPEQFRAE